MANEPSSIVELRPAARIGKIAPWIVGVALCGALAALSLWQYESAKAHQARELSAIQNIINDLVAAKIGPLIQASQIADELKNSTDPSTKAKADALSSSLSDLQNKLINVGTLSRT